MSEHASMRIIGNVYSSVLSKKKTVSAKDENDIRKKYINCLSHFDSVSNFKI